MPETAGPLADQVAAGVARLRHLDLAKPPGIAEAISWAGALQVLGAGELNAASAERTAGAVLKYSEDFATMRRQGFAALTGQDD